jgi:hypothetical protein
MLGNLGWGSSSWAFSNVPSRKQRHLLGSIVMAVPCREEVARAYLGCCSVAHCTAVGRELQSAYYVADCTEMELLQYIPIIIQRVMQQTLSFLIFPPASPSRHFSRPRHHCSLLSTSHSEVPAQIFAASLYFQMPIFWIPESSSLIVEAPFNSTEPLDFSTSLKVQLVPKGIWWHTEANADCKQMYSHTYDISKSFTNDLETLLEIRGLKKPIKDFGWFEKLQIYFNSSHFRNLECYSLTSLTSKRCQWPRKEVKEKNLDEKWLWM